MFAIYLDVLNIQSATVGRAAQEQKWQH